VHARSFLLIVAITLVAGPGIAVVRVFAGDEAAPTGVPSPDREIEQLAITRTADGVRTLGNTGLPIRQELEALVMTLASGGAVLTPGRIRVRGVTADKAAWQQAVDRLDARLPDGFALVTDVFVIAADKPKALLCREMFVASTREPIRFQQAGATLRTSSYAALDRLVEFAADCPEAAIRITGHSDSVGDPAFNLDLSLRRARSVASYLEEHGVALERLEVVGAGASEPVADNATSYGRRQNRRIEFSLSMPDSP